MLASEDGAYRNTADTCFALVEARRLVHNVVLSNGHKLGACACTATSLADKCIRCCGFNTRRTMAPGGTKTINRSGGARRQQARSLQRHRGRTLGQPRRHQPGSDLGLLPTSTMRPTARADRCGPAELQTDQQSPRPDPCGPPPTWDKRGDNERARAWAERHHKRLAQRRLHGQSLPRAPPTSAHREVSSRRALRIPTTHEACWLHPSMRKCPPACMWSACHANAGCRNQRSIVCGRCMLTLRNIPPGFINLSGKFAELSYH